MSRHGRKMSDKAVVSLRKKYHSLKDGGYNTATFLRVQAREHGVSERSLWDALNGETYKDVGGEQND